MGKPGSKFSDCGQAFRTRHLLVVQPRHFFSAFAQLLNHLVEASSEVTDFVCAIGKAYPDIEVSFSDAHNLVLQFHPDKPEIIATICRGENLVPVFLAAKSGEGSPSRSPLAADTDHGYTYRAHCATLTL
jgi:hypothetical protein